jgi:hypothetical protein
VLKKLSLCTCTFLALEGRCFDLPFEAFLQQYLKFPYEYFLFHSGVTVVNFVLQTPPEEKFARNKIR